MLGGRFGEAATGLSVGWSEDLSGEQCYRPRREQRVHLRHLRCSARSERGPPAHCAICEDERQYVGWDGQSWTTLEELRGRYRNVFVELEPDLIRIGTEPQFAIGQHAYLIRTQRANVLWDCISYLDEDTVAAVEDLGGLAAITISHPHFYASSVDWSHAFGGVPILLPAVDRDFVMRPDPSIRHFDEDEIDPVRGLRLVRLGGHFHGSTVLLWPLGAEGRGVLLVGDTIGTVMDRRYVTFLYSYPNRIPLPASSVREIAARVSQMSFDRLYGAWPGDVISSGAKEAVLRSAERYVGMLDGTWPRK